MRISRLPCLVLLLTSIAAFADSKNPADYPLRIRIYGREQTTFYRNHVEEEAKGTGRANLFENSIAHGVDFSYDCDEKLRASFGYETYMARWKKPGKELVVLLPVFGKSNTFFTCNLKTDVKDFTYTSNQGRMGSEPVDKYKAWMDKVQYDPEHGKNMPINLNAGAPQSPPPAGTPLPPASPNP